MQSTHPLSDTSHCLSLPGCHPPSTTNPTPAFPFPTSLKIAQPSLALFFLQRLSRNEMEMHRMDLKRSLPFCVAWLTTDQKDEIFLAALLCIGFLKFPALDLLRRQLRTDSPPPPRARERSWSLGLARDSRLPARRSS